MKKFSSILLMLIVCIGLNAQWFSLGIKAGYNTTLSSSQQYKEIFDVKDNLQNGFHAGIFMRMGRRVFAQPEVVYNFSRYNSTINNNTKKFTTQSVDVPVLFGVSMVNTNIFKLRLMVGPKFSFDVGSTKLELNREDISNSIRKARVGLDCGLGFDIWRVTIDVRYNLFSNVYKIKDQENNIINDKPQHTFQVSAGIRLFGDNK